MDTSEWFCSGCLFLLQGKAEYLGRTKAQPMVKLDPADARTPVLQWYEVKRAGKPCGELLAAFELFQVRTDDSSFASKLCLPFLDSHEGLYCG